MNYQLSQPLGNNLFSYDQRKQLGSDCTLIISQPSEINSLDQVQLDDFIVFEEIDHNNKLQSCSGLAHTYILKSDKANHIPIIITDNHNHVLPYWLDLISLSNNQQTNLIHIDQHSDLGPNTNKIDLSQIHNAQYQWDFAYLKCNIGNFILPCIDSKLITSMTQVRTEYALREESNKRANKGLKKISYKLNISQTYSPIIVDIDLDFWAPEMGISNREKTMSQVRNIMNHADLITIATSPYFIDQTLALDLLNQLLGPRFQSQEEIAIIIGGLEK